MVILVDHKNLLGKINYYICWEKLITRFVGKSLCVCGLVDWFSPPWVLYYFQILISLVL